MKAMILAAGRGNRLRPLTDNCPKPLIKVCGKPLLQYHLEKLKLAGIREVVINTAYLGQMIESFVGDGGGFGLKVAFSREAPGGLETAGGIVKALPFFEGENFLVINGDIFIDEPYQDFLRENLGDAFGRLFLTSNPSFHPQGDFSLNNGVVINGSKYTFAGVAVYNPRAFAGIAAQRAPLKPLFDVWVGKGRLQGAMLKGHWFDVGTKERLDELEAFLRGRKV